LARALRGLANDVADHGYRAIRAAFHPLGAGQLALTDTLGLASYACPIGFDAIALPRSGKRLHPAREGNTAYHAHTLGQT
ncbi:hypothetical protein, partial [Stenotrophomonas sp. SrG]|uniref:hypothetical protein n=1 Tax=Stenotrophomonas sp. SrG TaxID=3414430 RepID=UPI003CFBA999